MMYINMKFLTEYYKNGELYDGHIEAANWHEAAVKAWAKGQEVIGTTVYITSVPDFLCKIFGVMK